MTVNGTATYDFHTLDLERLTADMEARNDDLEVALSDKVMAVSNMQHDLEEEESKLAQLQKGSRDLIQGMEAQLETARADVAFNEEIKKELLVSIHELDGSIYALEEEDSRLKSRIARLDAENERLDAVISKLQNQAIVDNEHLDEAEQECEALSEEVQELEEVLQEVQEQERKCSREYIAYEKARKRNAAKAPAGPKAAPKPVAKASSRKK